LLGAAFDAGDVDKTEELAAEGATRWKLDSILQDHQVSTRHVVDAERRASLGAVVDRLRRA
jgi:hypothetical protein